MLSGIHGCTFGSGHSVKKLHTPAVVHFLQDWCSVLYSAVPGIMTYSNTDKSGSDSDYIRHEEPILEPIKANVLLLSKIDWLHRQVAE